MTRVFKSRGGNGPKPGRCCAALDGIIWGDAQCTRKEVLFEPDQQNVVRGWCKQHAPSTIKAKREAREAKWREQGELRRERWEREERQRSARDKAVSLLRLIAMGVASIDGARKSAAEILEELDR